MDGDPSDANTSAASSAVESQPAVSSAEPNSSAAPAAANPDANAPAASSPADNGANAPKTLLEAVTGAAGSEGATVSPAEPNKPGQPAPAQPNADPNAAKPTDAQKEEQDKQLPFHQHPRFQELIKESRELKTIKEQLPVIQRDAEEYRGIERYMEANGLTAPEVARGYEIMAAIKNDPVKARELLAEVWQNLSTFTGDVLPQDLQQEVEEGKLTAERAKEIAALRHQSRFQEGRSQQSQQQLQQQEEQQRLQQSNNMLNSTAVSWEGQKRQTDPDYAEKADLVIDRVMAVVAQQGKPQTPEAAKKILDDAYAFINERFKRFAPRRAPVAPASSAASAPAATAEPKTLLEAVTAAAST